MEYGYPNIFNKDAIKFTLVNFLKSEKKIVSIVTYETGHGGIESRICSILNSKKVKNFDIKTIRCSFYPYEHINKKFSKKPDFYSIQEFIEKTPDYNEYTVLINGIEKFDISHYSAIKLFNPKKIIVIGDTSNPLNETYFMKFLHDNIIGNKIDFVNSNVFSEFKFNFCENKQSIKINNAYTILCNEQHLYNQRFPIDIENKYILSGISKDNQIFLDDKLYRELREIAMNCLNEHKNSKSYELEFYKTIAKCVKKFTFFCAKLERVYI